MHLLKHTAAVTAVLLLSLSLTACHFSVHIGGDEESSSSQSANVQTTVPPEMPSDTVPASGTTGDGAEQPAETLPENAVSLTDAQAAVCGKWEIASLGDYPMEAGQYGSEDYCRLFQMEFMQDGKVELYARSEGKTLDGAWKEEPAETVQLLIAEDVKTSFYPLGISDCKFTLADGTMTTQTDLGELVIRKTDSFTERSHPESAWLAGDWQASEVTDSNGNLISTLPNMQPAENLKVSIFTIEDTVGMYITESDDAAEGDIYFAQLQDDGSFLAQQEFEEGNLPEFRDSVLRVENEDQLLWFVMDQGIGIVTLKRQ